MDISRQTPGFAHQPPRVPEKALTWFEDAEQKVLKAEKSISREIGASIPRNSHTLTKKQFASVISLATAAAFMALAATFILITVVTGSVGFLIPTFLSEGIAGLALLHDYAVNRKPDLQLAKTRKTYQIFCANKPMGVVIAKLCKDRLSANTVVNYRLLPPGATTRQYAAWKIIGQDYMRRHTAYQQAPSSHKAYFDTTVFSKLEAAYEEISTKSFTPNARRPVESADLLNLEEVVPAKTQPVKAAELPMARPVESVDLLGDLFPPVATRRDTPTIAVDVTKGELGGVRLTPPATPPMISVKLEERSDLLAFPSLVPPEKPIDRSTLFAELISPKAELTQAAHTKAVWQSVFDVKAAETPASLGLAVEQQNHIFG